MHQLHDPLLLGEAQLAALHQLGQRRGIFLLEVRLAGKQNHDAELLKDVGLHSMS